MNTRSDRHILRVVIAGGGTGGHLFPGIAVAEEFCARNPENSILFVGPGRPFEVSTVSEKGFAHKRKFLKNNLDISKEVLKKCGHAEKTRAQELSLKDWICLYKCYN